MSVARLYDALRQNQATLYRVGGRVRVAHPVEMREVAVEKMEGAVKAMAKHVAEKLPEPDGTAKDKWRRAGLKPLDVCDEPCPEGVLLTECPVGWLIERCARYHCDLVLNDGAAPTLSFVPHAKWELKDREVPGGTVSGVLSIVPGWFMSAIKARKPELVAELRARAGRGIPVTGVVS